MKHSYSSDASLSGLLRVGFWLPISMMMMMNVVHIPFIHWT